MLEVKVEALQEIKPIVFNYEELKKELSVKLNEYKTMVYTDESIQVAKSDRAKLNKVKESLNDRRKDLEKEYMIPFTTFKDQINELIKLVDEPAQVIDAQVKEYEARIKEEKRIQITLIYSEIIIGEAAEVLTLKRIWKDEWLNVGTTIKKITAEIQSMYDKFLADFEIIDGMKSEFEMQLKDVYMKTLELSQVMRENMRLTEEKAKLEKLKAEKEEKAAKAKAEAEAKAEADRIAVEAAKAARDLAPADMYQESSTVMQDVEEVVAAEARAAEVPETLKVPVKKQMDFRVWVTAAELDLLGKFLVENKIKYGKVE